jgi:hypothetical protein
MVRKDIGGEGEGVYRLGGELGGPGGDRGGVYGPGGELERPGK